MDQCLSEDQRFGLIAGVADATQKQYRHVSGCAACRAAVARELGVILVATLFFRFGSSVTWCLKDRREDAPLPALAVDALDGGQEAWTKLFNAVNPRLWALLRYRGANETEAEEIAQATWTEFFQKREQFDRTRKFMPFFFAIAVRLWVDHMKRKGMTLREHRPKVSKEAPLLPSGELPGKIRKRILPTKWPTSWKCEDTLSYVERHCQAIALPEFRSFDPELAVAMPTSGFEVASIRGRTRAITANERAILFLRFCDHLPYDKIEIELSRPRSTLRRQCFQAVHKLAHSANDPDDE